MSAIGYGSKVQDLCDILQHLDREDSSADCEMAQGSDDDLGMDSDYSDSSVQGIIQGIENNM